MLELSIVSGTWDPVLTGPLYEMLSIQIIEAIAAFIMMLGASMNTLFVIKVTIMVLIRWSFMSPPPLP